MIWTDYALTSKLRVMQCLGLGTGRSLAPADVWFVDLDGFIPQDLDDFWGILAREEQERSLRFKFEILQQRFVITRGILRILLGQYLGQDPAQVAIAYSDREKPYLQAGGDLQFNLSHCENYALYGFSPYAIGVDLEKSDRLRSSMEIAQRFFHPLEVDRLAGLLPEEQSLAFLRHWVGKEACVKATGEGLSQNLRRICLQFNPTIALNADLHPYGPIDLTELTPSLKAIAAIALIRPNGVSI